MNYSLVLLLFIVLSPDKEICNSCLQIEIVIPDGVIKAGQSKIISFHLRNLIRDKVTVPSVLVEGFKADELCDYYIEIQKKDVFGRFSEIATKDTDYQYLPANNTSIVLSRGEGNSYSTNLDLLHSLHENGKYRLRIVIYNRKSIPECGEIISPWYNFVLK